MAALTQSSLLGGLGSLDFGAYGGASGNYTSLTATSAATTASTIYIGGHQPLNPPPVQPVVHDAVAWLRSRVAETCWAAS